MFFNRIRREYGLCEFSTNFSRSHHQIAHLRIKEKLDETNEELLPLAIIELRERFHLTSKEIVVPFEMNLGEAIKINVPKLGDKKAILDLSERNAKYYRLDQLKQIKIVDPDRHTNRIMAQMKKDLRLSVEPRHIECFDNSNIQGTNPVSACVVLKRANQVKKTIVILI